MTELLSTFWPYLAFIGLVAFLAYVLIRHGRGIEQAKVEKAQTDAAITMLKNTEAIDERVKVMPDSELNKHL